MCHTIAAAISTRIHAAQQCNACLLMALEAMLLGQSLAERRPSTLMTPLVTSRHQGAANDGPEGALWLENCKAFISGSWEPHRISTGILEGGPHCMVAVHISVWSQHSHTLHKGAACYAVLGHMHPCA